MYALFLAPLSPSPDQLTVLCIGNTHVYVPDSRQS